MGCLPDCKKCCFCLPLRYGLLTWVYIKLVFVIIMLGLCSTIMFADNFTALAILNLIALIVDIILNVVFLIGGHQKNVKLLKIFFYYSIGLCVLMILLAFVCAGVVIFGMNHSIDMWLVVMMIIYIISFLLSIATQSYFILLLRSEIIKLRSNCPYKFVKNPKDSEGAIQIEDDITQRKESENMYENEIN